MGQTDEKLPLGVFAAALTPMRADLAVDHGTRRALRWLLANGCDGVAPLGTTGEANSLALGERTELLERLVGNGCRPRGCWSAPAAARCPDTVALTRHAVALGAGGVLVLPPFYYKNVSDDGLFAFFDRVIQQTGDARLRLYLYHFPQMTAVPLSLALIGRLLRAYPQTIAGMKDSSGDLANMRAACESFPGFRVYAGTERYLLDVLRAGGAGCISATTNVTAPLAGAVYAAPARPRGRRPAERAPAPRARRSSRCPAIAALKRLLAGRSVARRLAQPAPATGAAARRRGAGAPPRRFARFGIV
ncbi:MAG: dihydrodipicolinate synthase family protein [Chromatiales bacterium]|nr:dihydrodipicolinate synthase family protein [Chromatiales bacterium]